MLLCGWCVFIYRSRLIYNLRFWNEQILHNRLQRYSVTLEIQIVKTPCEHGEKKIINHIYQYNMAVLINILA